MVQKADITPLDRDLGSVVALFLAAERCGVTETARAILEKGEEWKLRS
jgi:hypothetical protein